MGDDPSGDGWLLEANLAGYVVARTPYLPNQPAEFLLRRAPAITGIVRAPDGTTLAVRPRGSVEILLPDGGQRAQIEFVGNPDGSFHVPDLPQGVLVRVIAQADGYAETFLSCGLILEPGQTEHVELVLRRGVRVTGRVVDSTNGEPIPLAKVWADAFDYDPASKSPHARCDEVGNFELVGVLDEGVIEVEGEAYIALQILAKAEGYASHRMGQVVVSWRPPGFTYEVELALDPATCELRGRVLGKDDGEPIANAFVLIIDELSNHFGVRTNEVGEFYAKGLSRGECAVGSWFRRSDQTQKSSGVDTMAQAILQLDSQQTNEVLLELRGSQGSHLAGRVTDTDGAPVVGETVVATYHFFWKGLQVGLGSRTRETRTGEDGTYRFLETLPGVYTLRVSSESEGLATGFSLQLVVDIAEGESRQDLNLVLEPPCVLAGWVSAGDIPARELLLELLDESGDVLQTCIPTTLQMAFQFEPVERQNYRVRLRHGSKTLTEESAGPESYRSLAIVAGDGS